MNYIKHFTKENIFLLILVGISLFFLSCSTFNPYPNMQTHDYQNVFLYEMGNLSADTLLIVMEGSGWGSSLGRNWMGIWLHTGVTVSIVRPLGKDHTIVYPEKWKREPVVQAEEYFEDLDSRLLYTIENLIENYAESINLYLSNNRYESIFMLGFSEGAIILPLLYERIHDKEKINGMVAYAGGGFTMYDSLTILSTAKITPRQYKEMYTYILENYDKGIEEWSNSIGVDKYGNVLLYLTSVLEFSPFDYYKDINIPVLFLHGEKDYRVPVESTRYIQENLPEKPFEYIYYRNMGHQPSTWSHLIYNIRASKIRNDITNWISKIKNTE